MKKYEIIDRTKMELPLVYKAEYSFAPNQFILLKWYDLFGDGYILIPSIITKVKDDDYNGYICEVKVLNKWPNGDISGSIFMDIVAHRYTSFDDKIEEKHYNFIKHMVDKPEYIFYIEKDGDKYHKIYPFKF